MAAPAGREPYVSNGRCACVSLVLSLRLHRGQLLQGEIKRTDELLGSLGHSRISRHRDCRLLQGAKLLKASGWIGALADSGLHEALDELTREMLIEARRRREGRVHAHLGCRTGRSAPLRMTATTHPLDQTL